MDMRVRAGLKAIIGVAIGLVLAEGMFGLRDSWAFPHLNFYQPDAALGVHLAPNAQMALAFGGNRVTQVRTNARGLRGGDWAPPGPADVLVVGDSQVFGLGVQEHETFSARLQAAIGGGAHVLNAGVPTYGPLEYTSMVERLVLERRPDAVVYVLTMGNDLFELPRPNSQRHAVWDGWAVRKEHAPSRTLDFPFRSWLMSRSHLVFALRALLHAGDAPDLGVPSEGSWNELLTRAPATRVPALTTATQLQSDAPERARLREALLQSEQDLFDRFKQGLARDPRYAAAARALPNVAGDPTDIVRRRTTEAAADPSATASQLLLVALLANGNEPALRALAQNAKDTPLLEILDTRRTLYAELRAHSGASASLQAASLDALLERTKRACDAVAARLLVVSLPLDVQVSAAEWKKYGHAPIDLAPTRVLNQDVVARAHAIGALGLDATAALQAAEPGAFLDADPHLSPRGHAALARALHTALVRPPDAFVVPAGRSVFPMPVEWSTAPELTVEGDSDRCRAWRVREWVRLECPRSSPRRVMRLRSGGRGDAVIGTRFGNALVLPLLAGDRAEVELITPAQLREVVIDWAEGAQPRVRFEPPREVAAAGGPWQPSIEAFDYPNLGLVDAACAAAQGGARGCLLGTEQPCPPEHVAFGMLRRCVPRCARDRSCPRGRCVVWNGERGCVEP